MIRNSIVRDFLRNIVDKISVKDNTIKVNESDRKWIDEFNRLSISNKQSLTYGICIYQGEFINNAAKDKHDIAIPYLGRFKIKPIATKAKEIRDRIRKEYNYDMHTHNAEVLAIINNKVSEEVAVLVRSKRQAMRSKKPQAVYSNAGIVDLPNLKNTLIKK